MNRVCYQMVTNTVTEEKRESNSRNLETLVSPAFSTVDERKEEEVRGSNGLLHTTFFSSLVKVVHMLPSILEMWDMELQPDSC